MAIRSISLFAGAGGLDLAMGICFPGIEPLLYVENEATAAEILASRIKEGSLPPAHIWSDITRLNGCKLCGAVDLIYGGFPCTDLSVAGKQSGIEGEKSGLWFEYLRLIREIQPRWVFIENVPGVLSLGNGRAVLGGLAEAGFDAEWGTFSAAGVGASHLRKRVFILAYTQRKPGCAEREQKPGSELGRRAGALDGPVFIDASPELANTDSRGFGAVWRLSECGTGLHDRPEQPGGGLGHAVSPRLEIGRSQSGNAGQELTAIERASFALPVFAPGPEAIAWNDLLVRNPWLRPAIAQAEAESIVCRLAYGMAHRPYDRVEWSNDKECSSKDGPEKDPGATPLREVRENGQGTSATSHGLQPATEGNDSMLQVPQKSGSRNRIAAQSSTKNMLGLRSPVSTRAQQARHALWFIGVQSHLRRIVGEEEMGAEEQDQILRSLWNRVSVQEAAREDLLPFLREQACMDFPEVLERALRKRADALRAAGNGVVAITGALAFIALARRAGLI